MRHWVGSYLFFLGLCSFCFSQSEQASDLPKKLETAHFILLYDEAPGSLDDMSRFLESNIEKVFSGLKVRPNGKILMEVYPSLDRFHQRQWGKRREDWRVGNTDEKTRIIRMVSPNNPGSQHNYQSILKVALHEAVHKLTGLLQKDFAVLPMWLLEGVAGYYSGQLNGHRQELQMLIREKKVPRIEELDGSAFLEHNGYPFSAALVEYLARNYGEEKLLSLLKNSQLRNPSMLEKELSINLDALNRNWQADLAKTYIQASN